jgi:outer membrane protein
MKKGLVLAAVLGMVLMAMPLQAKDIVKGTVELSGKADLSFDGLKTKYKPSGNEYTSTTYGLSVNPQYYVINNLAIGLGIGYTYRNSEMKIAGYNGSKTTTTENYALVGPIVGYNISLGEKFSIKPWVGFYFAKDKVTTEVNHVSDTTDYSGYLWDAAIEGKYFIADPVSLNLGLGYGAGLLKDDNYEIEPSEISVDLGISVYFK